MTIRERIAREYIRRWLPHMHLAHNPGKSPEYKKAIDKPMNDMRARFALKGPKDFDSPEAYQEYYEGYCDYCEMKMEEVKENGITETGNQ